MILDSDQWAQTYNASRERKDQKVALKSIVEGFLQETHQLVQMRDAQTNESLFKILDQQQSKWNALVRKVDDDHPYPLNRKLFNRIIRKYDAAVAASWMDYKMKKHGIDPSARGNKN